MKRRLPSICCVALIMMGLAVGPLTAAELAGVSMPDQIDVGGKSLVLNGLGLREATFLKVDVYVAGLYLEEKSRDAGSIIDSDQTKRIRMKFVRKVSKKDITKAWSEGFDANAFGDKGALKSKVGALNSWMPDVADGDTMTFTYEPGQGVEVRVNGETKGTIEGGDFAKSFVAIFLGPKPPNPGLKKGMLGG